MRRSASVAALAIVLVSSSPAIAGPRSLRTAYALSGTGTGVSGALFLSAFVVKHGDVSMPLIYAGLGGALISPSLGQLYAGRYLTLGLGIRAAAAGLATYAVTKYTQTVRCNETEMYSECTNLSQNSYPLLGIAAIALVGGVALDFKDLPASVTRYNERHGFTIAPAVISVGGHGAGLAAVGTF